jgi:hypothetical protein
MVSLFSLALLTAAINAAVTVPLVPSAPRLDCALDDEAWTGAAVLEGFRQTHPLEDAEPSHKTLVRLVYTTDALHVAIEAFDDPTLIRSTLANRDGIGAEDHVALYLDTFSDRRRAYVLMVNALGVQQDGLLVEGREPDFSIDLDFRSSGCVTKHGYTIEISLPFQSIRYNAGEGRSWGVHVIRQVQRLGEENSWMPLRRDRTSVDGTSGRQLRSRFLSQAGVIDGLDRAAHIPIAEVIPVVGGTRTQGGKTQATLGGTARIGLSPATALDIAVNPDFAEVEADEPQSTANQRFPLFYAEKRPFFLERADLLTTPIRAFHSRTIVDPDGALKLTTTRGRTSAAVLVATDPAPGRYTDAEQAARPAELAGLVGKDALSTVVRVRREVGLDSSVGFLGTSWSFADRRNQTAGFDARLALGARTTWNAQAIVTTSHLPFRDAASGTGTLKTATGFGYSTELSRTSARLSLQVLGEGYTPEYRATLGYLQRSDTNRWSAIARYNGRSSHGPLLSWSAINTTLAQFDWRARMQYGYLYPRLLLAFKRQTYLNLSAYRDYARVFEEEFGPARSASGPGAFLGAPERSTWYHGFTIDTGTSPTRSVTASFVFDASWNNLDFDRGAGRFPRVSPAALVDPKAALDPGRADSRYLGVRTTWQPSTLARLTLAYEASRLTRQDTGLDAYRQRIASGRLLVSLSRFLWIRGRVDYDSLDRHLFHQLVFAWTPKPGRAVYAGYDETGEWMPGKEPRAPLSYARQGRTIFIKATWSRALRLRPARSAATTTSPS